MSNVRDRCWQRDLSPNYFKVAPADFGPWTLDFGHLTNETKADAERDLRELTSAAGADVAEKARRERLLRHLESADKAHPLELAKYSLERAGASSPELDIKQ